jgi:peptidoglycan/xylan/chitin deacetylase (PgdA/CDA1 family)
MSADVAFPGGALVISLDFELHWGVRDKRTVAQDRDRLLGARAALPAILERFAAAGIHATWAIVGLLLAETKREMLARLPAAIPYVRPALSPHAALIDVGDSERDDPFHFAPSLARRIAAAPAQEVGTHTFSHYYCLEPGQMPAHFRADLAAAIGITRDRLGIVPRSIVFPRNQVSAAHVAVCDELGIRAYRGNREAWAYRARRDQDERLVRRAVRLIDAYVPVVPRARYCPSPGWPVNVAATRYLRPCGRAVHGLEALRERRIGVELARAAREQRIFHLWWHPDDFGLRVAENVALLGRVLDRFRALRDRTGMESLTMGEVAERLASSQLPAAAGDVASSNLS